MFAFPQCECRELNPNLCLKCIHLSFTHRNHLTSIKSLSIELATTVITESAGQGIEPHTCTHHIPQDLRWNRTNSRMCLSYIASTHSATCHNDRYSNLSYFYIHSGFFRSVCNVAFNVLAITLFNYYLVLLFLPIV